MNWGKFPFTNMYSLWYCPTSNGKLDIILFIWKANLTELNIRLLHSIRNATTSHIHLIHQSKLHEKTPIIKKTKQQKF